MTTQVFVLSVITGIIGSILAGIFLFIIKFVISTRKEKIRRYLANSRTGWLRRKYIRIFINAVRGETQVNDSRSISRILLIYPVGACLLFVLFFGVTRGLVRHNEYLRERLIAIDTVIAPHETDIDIGAEVVNLNDRKAELHSSLDNTDNQLAYFTALLILNATLSFVYLLWKFFYREPILVYQANFTYELNRFLMWIQGLASKKELAEIAQLEATVRDEATAMEYVAKIAAVSRRYGVHHLVDTFILWDSLPEEVQGKRDSD